MKETTKQLSLLFSALFCKYVAIYFPQTAPVDVDTVMTARIPSDEGGGFRKLQHYGLTQSSVNLSTSPKCPPVVTWR